MVEQWGRLAVAGSGDVSWCLNQAEDPGAMLVLAHGAGAGMEHGSLTELALAVVARGLDVLRFNFPFMEVGRRRVDPKPVATATIAAAVALARMLTRTRPLLLGGHSFGGRMASHAVLDHDLGRIDGMVFCSFPLHPANKPGISRAAHLVDVGLPMLFLSGTRDALAAPELLNAVVAGLGDRAHLRWLDTADHSYRVQKRMRQRSDSIFEEMAEAIAHWSLQRS